MHLDGVVVNVVVVVDCVVVVVVTDEVIVVVSDMVRLVVVIDVVVVVVVVSLLRVVVVPVIEVLVAEIGRIFVDAFPLTEFVVIVDIDTLCGVMIALMSGSIFAILVSRFSVIHTSPLDGATLM